MTAKVKSAPRELHIHKVETLSNGITKYRFEIWDTIVGVRKRTRRFTVHGNQHDRMVERYVHQFRIDRERVFHHDEQAAKEADNG